MKLKIETFAIILLAVKGAAATTTISTDPPYNPLATGFNNLIVTAQFPTPTSNTDSCAWFYGGELDSGSGTYFYSAIFGGCDPPAPGTYDSITCTEQTIDGTNHTVTTLTIIQPLVAGNLNIEVRCSLATTPGPITRTVQNCPSSLSYGVVVTSSSQTYQASGMFSCSTGDLFYSNGTSLSSGDTTCLANAEWNGQTHLQCASATAKISTNPPNNPLATGFNNLIVTAQFPAPTSNTDACFWFYGGELDSGSGAQFYSGIFGGCVVPLPGTYDSITCTEQTIDGTNHIITTLTITQPLVPGDKNVEVRCLILTNTPGPITKTVQDCQSSLSYGVVVTSSSRTYQASGMFSCPTGDLFYSNGTAPSSSNTICLANAQWLAQDNLLCTGASPGTKISTDPPNNPLATGFNNLIVTAQFPTPTSNTDTCSWFYGGELDSEGSGASFYSGLFGGCAVPSPGTYDTITCTEQTIDGTNHTITILTITQPLVSGNVNIEVRCTTATTPGPITRTVQDCPSSLSYGVVVTSSSRTYQASGMFSCPTGDLFYSNGTAPSSSNTICLANAQWLAQDNLQCTGASPGTKISTDPPNNPLATGFNNLIVTAQFPTPTSNTDTCSWFYGGELDSEGSGASFYSGLFGGCVVPSPGTYDTITCTEQTIDGKSHTITALTITQPLVAGDINIEVRCAIAVIIPGSVTMLVQDCPSSFPYGVVITSSSRTYKTSGMFSCPTGDLFYSNGTALPSGDTLCLANAEWSGQNYLQCWSASDPLMTGNLIVSEGDTTSLACNYDETVFPEVTSLIFYFDELGYVISKDEMFHVKLEKEDNMKPISCQVVTPYTQIYNDTGRSRVEHVNVQYASFGMENISCSWTIDKTEVCDISFFSNPEMKFVFLSLNDKSVSNDGKDIVFSNGYEHHYLYTRNQVTSNDEGTYNLILSHLLPPYNYLIEFDVTVVNIDQPPTPDNTGAIVGGIVAAVALICITVVLALYITRRQPILQPEDKTKTFHHTIPQMVNEEYVELENHVQGNIDRTNGAYESIDRLKEGKDGYLEVHTGQQQATTSNYENTGRGQNYENIEGPYDGEI
ncbi:uncharacterized protein LOC143446066 [Clavelina lepadiformis]|uniref:uncharacterized protein LOC143446066 n=1 Tax=Clavelina lepadiformis TaxID=159417 RepID=UPI0040423EF1